MKKILTGTQMKAVDEAAINNFNIPGIRLMEHAGEQIYFVVKNLVQDKDTNVLIICGKGNNGGDGFVLGRLLKENNYKVKVLSLYKKEELKGDALTSHENLSKHLYIHYYSDFNNNEINMLLADCEYIIDAILGTGITSEVKDKPKEIIELINKSNKKVISIDIPSGVNSDDGKIPGLAIKANHTVTIGAPKIGNILYPAAEFNGELYIKELPIPENLIYKDEHYINLLTPEYIKKLIPKRIKDSNKGAYGKAFTIAGSFGMAGSAYLAAYSILKCGSGYSLMACPDELIKTLTVLAPEIVYLGTSKEHFLGRDSLNTIINHISDSKTVLIGPGIGTNSKTKEFIEEFFNKQIDDKRTYIIDADAINCISKIDNIKLPKISILTPHPKELSRLLKVDLEQILEDRIKHAQIAAEKYSAIVILKGAKTVIASPNKEVFINPTGNSALATAGTGDVLAGMIAGFSAQGAVAIESANIGVYLHGLAGEIASTKLNEYSVTATDVMQNISDSINTIIRV